MVIGSGECKVVGWRRLARRWSSGTVHSLGWRTWMRMPSKCPMP